MSIAIYTNGDRPSTTSTPTSTRRRALTGTAHSGPHWVGAARLLRMAVQNAIIHAQGRRSITADRVGSTIIDEISKLDGKSLHLLSFVFSILVRNARQ
jgi:hypothetical protein